MIFFSSRVLWFFATFIGFPFIDETNVVCEQGVAVNNVLRTNSSLFLCENRYWINVLGYKYL